MRKPCSVLLLDFAALLSTETMTCPCRMQVTANLMQEMAKQLLFFNTKIRSSCADGSKRI